MNHRISRIVPGFLVAIALLAAVLSVYWQAGGHAFTNIDDDVYVSENPFVLRGLTPESVSWAFATFHAGTWHPLSWLSHMLDVELFGPGPGWHHRMNVLYHLLNTELLFFVLWRMTGGLWQSAFVAALFGVHPLHVESVAWVTERKDVLSTLFWILTMGAYLRYVRRNSFVWYLLVTLLFALGLMCKQMLVTLPFVLLLLDWWPLGRVMPYDSPDSRSWRSSVPVVLRLAREKIPLFALSALACVIAYSSQSKGGNIAPSDLLPFGARVSNAVWSYVVYLGKMVWPSSLAVYYPHPVFIHANIPAWKIAGAVLLLCGISFFVLRESRRRPYLVVGWLWYLVTLVPVIGFVQIGGHAYADRFTYFSLTGIFMAIAWGVPEIAGGWRFRKPAIGAFAGLSLVAFSITAWIQTGYWRDSVTLWSHAVAVTERNWRALNNLGLSYSRLGQIRQAIGYYREALQILPDDPDAWNNLGVAYGRLGQNQQAIDCYMEALRVKPDHVQSIFNLGLLYNKLGQHQQAIGCFTLLLKIEPGFEKEWNNMGLSYIEIGQHQQAILYLLELLRIQPDNAEAWNNLGVAYGKLGVYQQAIVYFREALRYKPDFTEARNNLVVASGKLGQSR